MANTVEQWQVEQYKDNVIHLAQQMGSRLRGTVTEESVTGEKFHFERLGTAPAVKGLDDTQIRQFLIFHIVADQGLWMTLNGLICVILKILCVC